MPTTSNPILTRVLRGAIVAVLAIAIAGLFWPPAKAIVLHAKGKTGTCSLAESVEAIRVRKALREASIHFTDTSHLITKDPIGIELWETQRGRFWVESGGSMMQFFDILGEQQTNIYGVGEASVHAGDVVLDCGANVGAFTRTALDSGAKLVVAIEPAPKTVECLRRNFQKEIAAGRVVVAPLGVWNKEDVLPLNINSNGSWGDSFVRPEGGAVTRGPQARLTAIDTLVSELKLPRVDFIKMDIEGAEKQAIAGARETIRRYKPRMALCTYHLPDDPVAIPQMVHELVPSYRSECLCEPDDDERSIGKKVVRFF
jgi:FkbM family methyltransferase